MRDIELRILSKAIIMGILVVQNGKLDIFKYNYI